MAVSLAVTGGLACGKSTVGHILKSQGAAIREADEIAHEVMATGKPVCAAVLEAFGPRVRADDGGIDREKLASLVFSDRMALKTLNSLVHPAVRAMCLEWRARQSAEGRNSAVIVPLLFEAGWINGWDEIWCVASRREKVMERLKARGIPREEALRRLAAQWPLEEKVKRADIVIENNGSREELVRRTLEVWNELISKER